MSIKEKIHQTKAKHPTWGYKAIAQKIGCAYSTVAFHLNPETNKKVLARKLNSTQRFMIELKDLFGGACSCCGYDRCFAALEFHHIFQELKDRDCARIADVVKTKGKAAALKELELCILVCANCHREIHEGIITVESGGSGGNCTHDGLASAD